jgi:hypothetical protein
MTKLDPIATLQSDHRVVRDILLELIEASSRRDAIKSLELLIRLDKLGGPHFRFEEESLYPTLEKYFGQEYYEYLLSAHDRIIRSSKKLSEILGKGEITDEEANELPTIIRSQILPHPIECDGLTMLAEKLSQVELEEIRENLKVALKDDIPLLEWANTVRERKV